MRMSILNTATTEQVGYGIISFFVYMKSTNQDFSSKTHIHNNPADRDDILQKGQSIGDTLLFS